jgi:hypothetical protein
MSEDERYEMVRFPVEMVEHLQTQPAVLVGVERHDDGAAELVFRAPEGCEQCGAETPETIGENRAFNEGYAEGLKDGDMADKWEERGREIDTLGYERGEMLRAFRAIVFLEIQASRLPYQDGVEVLKRVGDMARDVLRDFA